jgi:hypothetical protein
MPREYYNRDLSYEAWLEGERLRMQQEHERRREELLRTQYSYTNTSYHIDWTDSTSSSTSWNIPQVTPRYGIPQMTYVGPIKIEPKFKAGDRLVCKQDFNPLGSRTPIHKKGDFVNVIHYPSSFYQNSIYVRTKNGGELSIDESYFELAKPKMTFARWEQIYIKKGK